MPLWVAEGHSVQLAVLRHAGCVEVVLVTSGCGRHLGQLRVLCDDVHRRAGHAVGGHHLRPVAGAEQVHGAAGLAAGSVARSPDPWLSVRHRGAHLGLQECTEARLGVEAVPVGVALLRVAEFDVAVRAADVLGAVPHDGLGILRAVGLARILAFARAAVAVGLVGGRNGGRQTDQKSERGDDCHCDALHDLPICLVDAAPLL